MQIYLVGGAVRDQLLGLDVQERDWVVVGSTVEEMLHLGYQPVGKDFPVFLHPKTKEEYALARTERKSGKGYKGFLFHADPTVTLEEDLRRRDLTINAIAQTQEGIIIDPYGGQEDLQNKCFHHVSDAFSEDPVRILRLARFASRFVDFKTHPDTIKLMQDMVVTGEVDALVPERVWKECEQALANKAPVRFFEELNASDALDALFPCKDSFVTNQQALERACALSTNPWVRWAAWNATQTSAENVIRSERYRIPNAFKELSARLIHWAKHYIALSKKHNSESILNLIVQIGALRHEENLLNFQQACTAISELNLTVWNQSVYKIRQALTSIDTQEFQTAGLTGKDFADALKGKRLTVIEKMLTQERL